MWCLHVIGACPISKLCGTKLFYKVHCYFASLRSALWGTPAGFPTPLRLSPTPTPPRGEGLSLASLGSVGHPCGVPHTPPVSPHPQPPLPRERGLMSLASLGSGRLRRRFLVGGTPGEGSPDENSPPDCFHPHTRGFVCKHEQSIVYDCEVRAATKPAYAPSCAF